MLGWLVTSMALLGVGSWLGVLAYNQRQELAQLKTQVQGVVDTESNANIQKIQTDLDGLKQQVPENLKAQVEAQDDRITGLEQSIAKLAEQTGDRQQAIAVMAKALQELVATDSSQTSPEASSPAPSASEPDKGAQAEAEQKTEAAASLAQQNEPSRSAEVKATDSAQPISSDAPASE